LVFEESTCPLLSLFFEEIYIFSNVCGTPLSWRPGASALPCPLRCAAV